MGKAIISTKLSNEMPFPILHGKHVHFVQTEEEIDSAVRLLINDHQYRQQLENGAREYFDEYLAPQIVIRRLIDQAAND